jgi:hypothetical protein
MCQIGGKPQRWRGDVRISWRAAGLLFAVGYLIWMAPAAAEDRIALCHAGLIKLVPFAQHIKELRKHKRYEPADIDKLIAQQRKGGAEFFTSQIIVQEEQTGSGTFDLRLFHGLSDAASYRNVTAWACQADDYPIAYFVGFRVRKIENGTIFVTREKDVLNVIALKALDGKLDKKLKVQVFEGSKVLCEDLGKSCAAGIWYSRE